MSTKFPRIEKLLDTEQQELTKLIEPKMDMVSLVLRFHLLSEWLLERIIMAFLPRGDRVIEKGRLGYHQKLELVNAFDKLPDRIIGALRNLNRLRNDCSHERDAKITMSDVERIGRPLGKSFTEFQRKYGRQVEALSVATFTKIYTALIKEVLMLELTKKNG